MKADEFATLIHGAKRRADGHWWDGRCPAHADTHASLSFAGCTREAIARAVGRSVADFAHESNGARRGDRRCVVTSYDYRDEHGSLLYQVCRFEPKDFRCRQPDGRGGWRWTLDGVRIVPYRLHELAEATRVFIPEGEKDVDSLHTLGLVATCNHGGAGKWRPEHTQALLAAAVREVVVLCDNDGPGAGHQDSVMRSCVAGGLRVKRLETLPGWPPLRDKHGEDVSNWLADDHTVDELLTLADAAPWVDAVPGDPAAGAPDDGRRAIIVPASMITPEEMKWLWPGRLAVGALTNVIGLPDQGKTLLLCDLVARLTSGSPMPPACRSPGTIPSLS